MLDKYKSTINVNGVQQDIAKHYRVEIFKVKSLLEYITSIIVIHIVFFKHM